MRSLSAHRPLLAAALSGFLSCAGSAATPRTDLPAAQGRSGPTLVVLLTVDQLRADYLDKWNDQFQGGFRRLLDSGAVFTNAHQDHAITETAPGHSTLLSGRFPRNTGITRNAAGVYDSSAALIGVPGFGASPVRFRGTTLVDWIAARDSGSRALSVSVKDRGAILPVGRSRQEVYWFAAGNFTTSRYYRDSLPTWVQAFNARWMPARYAGQIWDLLLPAASYPEPDSVPVENQGRTVTLPKLVPPDSSVAARILPAFPFMEEVLVAFALEGVGRLGLGRGPRIDVLAVSFSSTDYIGHAYGPDSRELHDQVVRLDRQIGVFLDSLFRLVPREKVVLALTSDHGVIPFPELSQDRYSPPPLRVNIGPAVAAARGVLGRARADTTAVDLESGALLVDRTAAGVTAALADAAADSFVAAARRIPGVLRAERYGGLGRLDPGQDPIARRWLQMFPPDVPVEAVVVLTPGSYPQWVTYALHGTPHDDDTHVPLIFYGPQFRPGRQAQFVRTVDLAPTLAEVIGVTPAEPLDGRPLRAAIK